jgi:DNA-binding CsgD family transcriptional regulator
MEGSKIDALRASEIRSLLDAATAVGGARDANELAEAVLHGVAKLVPSDLASYNLVQPEAGRSTARSAPGDAYTPNLLATFAEHMHQHPLIERTAETGDFATRRISDVVSQRDFQRREVYVDFFRPLGLRFQLALSAPLGPDRILGVTVNRGRRDFSDHECTLLHALRPHVLNAHRGLEARARAEALLAGLDETAAFILVDRDGRIDFATTRARALLTAYFNAEPDGRVLPIELDRDVVVAREEATLRATHTIAGAVRLIVLEEDRRVPSENRLRQLGLTKRETEVIRHAARGAMDAQIAHELGISIRTVHKHLEHAYDKLGVRTRTAAVAKALGP